jgi:hypothetical protein
MKTLEDLQKISFIEKRNLILEFLIDRQASDNIFIVKWKDFEKFKETDFYLFEKDFELTIKFTDIELKLVIFNRISKQILFSKAIKTDNISPYLFYSKLQNLYNFIAEFRKYFIGEINL